jgi:catechol 2,3-dioxygenase-like lactoylglutathione lyase family enzyme
MPAAPLDVGRFNHATLNCRDVPRSVAFYRDVLGFQRLKRPGFSFAGAWLYRDGLGMMLHLNEHQSAPAPAAEIQILY